MAILKRKTPKTYVPFAEKDKLKKLAVYITIVNNGQADSIIRLMQNFGSSAQFVQSAVGTANQRVLDILGISDEKKEVVLAIIRQDAITDMKQELEAFFAVSKNHRGVGFAIPVTSLIGVKLYQFLTNSLPEVNYEKI